MAFFDLIPMPFAEFLCMLGCRDPRLFTTGLRDLFVLGGIEDIDHVLTEFIPIKACGEDCITTVIDVDELHREFEHPLLVGLGHFELLGKLYQGMHNRPLET